MQSDGEVCIEQREIQDGINVCFIDQDSGVEERVNDCVSSGISMVGGDSIHANPSVSIQELGDASIRCRQN